MASDNPCRKLEEEWDAALVAEWEAQARATIPPSHQSADEKIVPRSSSVMRKLLVAMEEHDKLKAKRKKIQKELKKCYEENDLLV